MRKVELQDRIWKTPVQQSSKGHIGCEQYLQSLELGQSHVKGDDMKDNNA